MKILITGGGGFLGSHLASTHIDRGDEVFILENGGTSKVKHLIGHPRFRRTALVCRGAELTPQIVARLGGLGITRVWVDHERVTLSSATRASDWTITHR